MTDPLAPAADLDTHEQTPIHVGEDGPVAAVMRVLDLRRDGADHFRGISLHKPNNRVYGGQVLAQAMLSAQATVDDAGVGERDVHSIGAYFLRPGKLDVPIDFEVERLHDGRSFSSRRTHALQNGVPILAMSGSHQLPQPGSNAARSMPNVRRPETYRSSLELFADLDHPAASLLRFTTALDVRHVEAPIYLEAAPDRAVEQHAWVRFREPLPDGLDQPTHRALLAYACDQLALEPVLRAVGAFWLTPGLSVATIDHSMHFHRRLDINDWHLFQQRCISAQGGRGTASADIFDSSGRQVASYTQEGMIRLPSDKNRTLGD